MNYKNKYIGNEDQLITVQESVLCQGRQQGTRMVHVENSAGLSVTILPDRGMDIYQVRFNGKNLCYLAPCGIVNPQYYDARGTEWLKGFYCGFLETIGLQNFGAPRGDHGLHGKESYSPAENVEIIRGLEKGKPTVILKGTMREAWLFGPNLRLTRSLKFYYDDNRIDICDTLENYGFKKQQYVLGYHINYGWPLISENTEFKVANTGVKGRNDYAEKYIDETHSFPSPSIAWPERCYYYDMKPSSKGQTGYSLWNKKENIGVSLSFSQVDFPKLCQWQLYESGQYVMSLEPLTCEMDVPLIGEKNSPAPILAAGEAREHKLVFKFSSSEEFF